MRADFRRPRYANYLKICQQFTTQYPLSEPNYYSKTHLGQLYHNESVLEDILKNMVQEVSLHCERVRTMIYCVSD